MDVKQIKDIKSFIQWFLEEILIVLFVLFILAMFGIEFLEYPYTRITIEGYNKSEIANDDWVFTPRWENIENTQGDIILSKINYCYYYNKIFCSKWDYEWLNPETSRIHFFSNYEFVLVDIHKAMGIVEIEIIYKKRAFLLIKGRDISDYINNFIECGKFNC